MTYERLEKDPYRTNTIAYTKLIDKYKNILTEKEKSYLLQFESRESNVYGLPKVHKSAKIASKCKEHSTQNIQISNITDWNLQLIMVGPNCLTHRLSNLIDILRTTTIHKRSKKLLERHYGLSKSFTWMCPWWNDPCIIWR